MNWERTRTRRRTTTTTTTTTTTKTTTASTTKSLILLFFCNCLGVLLSCHGSQKQNTVSAYIPSSRFQPIRLSKSIATCSTHSTVHTKRSNYLFANRNRNANEGDESDESEELFTPTTNTQSSIQNNNNIDTQQQQQQQLLLLQKEQEEEKYNYLDDLTPPPVNFARNSILFSENPSTKLRNNPPLAVWKFFRAHFPAIVTGAWPWRDLEALDEQPLAALYNALLVRLPVLAVGISYLYQKIAKNHDLVIDLGFDASGPQAVPPVLVIGVLVLILL